MIRGRTAWAPSRRVAAVVGLTLAILGAAAGSAEAARPIERRFVQMIKDTRVTATLPSLEIDERLTRIARRHSRRMAAAGDLYHSDIERLLGSRFSSVGENVGYAGSLDQLLRGFLGSPPHAANILGAYTHTGVGIARVDGQLWLTQVFAA